MSIFEAFEGGDSSAPVAAVSTSPPVSSAAVSVPEMATIKPGFKNRRWGSPPRGMKYTGRGDGLTKHYDPVDAECIELGGQTVCDVVYFFFKKKLFAVSFATNFVTRDAYRPSFLPDLEAEWGPGTPVGTGKEWRSRDKTYGLTIATWKPTTSSSGTRWETVKIWSERIDKERLKVESNPKSPEMRQLQKEKDDQYKKEQRKRERYKM